MSKQYNVTFISAWAGPKFFSHVDKKNKDELVQEGKSQQYNVIVEEIDEEELVLNGKCL